MRNYYIVNLKTKKYVDATSETESFDGDWKQRYPHIKDESYLWIQVVDYWDIDNYNGVYFIYDLIRDGMMATMIQTEDISDEQFDEAVKELKYSQDVVGRVSKLKIKRWKEVMSVEAKTEAT